MDKTYKFDYKTSEFVLHHGNPIVLTGKEALKMWIEKALRSNKRMQIYKGTGYGTDIEALTMGKGFNFDFTQSEIKREAEECLLKNDDIYAVTSCEVSVVRGRLNIEIELSTAYGSEEVKL